MLSPRWIGDSYILSLLSKRYLDFVSMVSNGWDVNILLF